MKKDFISESQGGTNTDSERVASVPYYIYEISEYKAQIQEKKKTRWMIAFFVAISLLCAAVLCEIKYVHNSTPTDYNEVLTYESHSNYGDEKR